MTVFWGWGFFFFFAIAYLKPGKDVARHNNFERFPNFGHLSWKDSYLKYCACLQYF